jgi:hypothetical protein
MQLLLLNDQIGLLGRGSIADRRARKILTFNEHWLLYVPPVLALKTYAKCLT